MNQVSVEIPKDGGHAFCRWTGPSLFQGWACVMCGKVRRPWRKRGPCPKNPITEIKKARAGG